MEDSFEHEYLLNLYTDGRSDDKKYRYQPQIIKGYQKAINFLRTAEYIEALWQIKSLHYEVLKGDKAGLSSEKVNDQYRIEFTVTLNEEHR